MKIIFIIFLILLITSIIFIAFVKLLDNNTKTKDLIYIWIWFEIGIFLYFLGGYAILKLIEYVFNNVK